MLKNNFRKSLVIGLIILFIGSAVTQTIGSITSKFENNISPLGRSWSDNFDTYTTGQFLDGTPDDGGWKGWDNDPAFGAYVVDDQALSTPHSVEIAYNTDLVHEYSGYTYGQWTYTAWVYVPSDFAGNSYFMILSDYTDGAGSLNKWQFVMRFDSTNGIVESENDGNSLLLITDQWIEIRVEIDLDVDWFQLFYDDDLLVERNWTAGWDGAGDGFLVIDAVDLYASGSSEIYYDDMELSGEALIPAVCCQGNIQWTGVEPGATLTGEFKVSNCGDDGTELNWEIDPTTPGFGSWTFTPASGTGLTPAQGWITVQVQCVAPTEKDKEFTGKIKVFNSDSPADYCEIDVYLKTPRLKTHQFPILQRLMERFLNAFPILKQILT